MKRLFIIGAGGFGREVFGIVSALSSRGEDWLVEGFIDDSPSLENVRLVESLGSRIRGTVADLAKCAERVGAVIAIGSSAPRAALLDRLASSKVWYPSLVHPDSTLGPGVTLGDGVIIAAGARLSTNIAVGRHVQVDQGATVGHDSVLEDFCRLNPQACVSGSVHIGAGALIGANATVLPGLVIGPRATVGSGAVVTRAVEHGQTVKGVPAR